MKRIMIAILAAVMALSMVSCGDSDSSSSSEAETTAAASEEETASAENESGDKADEIDGIDYSSTEVQTITDEKAKTEVLADIKTNWFGDKYTFTRGTDAEADYTYTDFKEKIGCDATEYYLYKNAVAERRCFTWRTEENDDKYLSALFENVDGEWLLYGTQYVNIG